MGKKTKQREALADEEQKKKSKKVRKSKKNESAAVVQQEKAVSSSKKRTKRVAGKDKPRAKSKFALVSQKKVIVTKRRFNLPQVHRKADTLVQRYLLDLLARQQLIAMTSVISRGSTQLQARDAHDAWAKLGVSRVD